MELPSHPDRDEPDGPSGPHQETGRGARVVLGVIVTLLVVVILLHLTGVVGPLSH